MGAAGRACVQVPSREATTEELTLVHTAKHVDAMDLLAQMSDRQRLIAADQYGKGSTQGRGA
mgnify:CR=1 FL=1